MAVTTTTKPEIKDVKAISPHDISGHVLQTTTDAYADILNLDARGQLNKLIILKNTGGSNGLKYQVLTSAHFSSEVRIEEIEETTLAAGANAKIFLGMSYARVVVQVKAAVASSQTTAEADFTMSGI